VHNSHHLLKILIIEIKEVMAMNKQNELLKQINRLRMQMIEIGSNKGLNDSETISISQELDDLLFDYQQITFGK
jgi:hypothetical protein